MAIELGPSKPMLWYLASPYSGNEEENFGKVLFLCAHLLEQEKLWVWSPIVYSHEMQIEYEPLTYDNWMTFDKLMLDRCDGLLVAAITGFEKSRGVKMEVRWAKERGIPIKFVNWINDGPNDSSCEGGSNRIEVVEDPELVEKLLAPTSESEIGPDPEDADKFEQEENDEN